MGSGKAAIALILGYLKLKGVLGNKMTPVLTPAWLGTWVYAQMLPYAFPSLHADAAASAVLCYHQYGFPQDMDRVLEIAEARGAVVIEDCAHAAASSYKGKPLGSIGSFGVFSYSKFVFCYALGGVVAKDAGFRGFVAEQAAKASIGIAVVCERDQILRGGSRNSRPDSRAADFFGGLTAMAYARYGEQVTAGPRALGLWLSKRKSEFEARRNNYHQLRSQVDRFGVCDHLETGDVTPYAVPLQVKDAAAGQLAGAVAATRHCCWRVLF